MNEMLKLLAFFLLQGLKQKLDDLFFPGGNFWKNPYYCTCSVTPAGISGIKRGNI
jgi:hypothetical protein